MSQPDARPLITPDMTVAALLEAYPELESLLHELAPALQKLTTPALLRSVAKNTSLHQAAQAGSAPLGELINRLREAAGQQSAPAGDRPDWVDSAEVERFDAREAIAGGSHPLPQVLGAVDKLTQGQAYAIVTPFVPTPMIEKIKAMGFQTWTEQVASDHFVTYFARS